MRQEPRSSQTQDPRCLREPEFTIDPVFPSRALADRVGGWVEIQFDIDGDGVPKNAKAADAYPVGYFEETTIEAFLKWRYSVNEQCAGCTRTILFRLNETFSKDERCSKNATIPIDALSKKPEVKKAVKARYPSDAKFNDKSGRVHLRVEICEDGSVNAVSIVKGVRADLDGAAISALLDFEFEPGYVNGTPVKTAIPDFNYVFQLID